LTDTNVVQLDKRGHFGLLFSNDEYTIVDSFDIDLTKKDFEKISKSKTWSLFDKKNLTLNKDDITVLFHFLGDAILFKVGKRFLQQFDFVKICHIFFMKDIIEKDRWSLNICGDCLKKVKK